MERTTKLAIIGLSFVAVLASGCGHGHDATQRLGATALPAVLALRSGEQVTFRSYGGESTTVRGGSQVSVVLTDGMHVDLGRHARASVYPELDPRAVGSLVVGDDRPGYGVTPRSTTTSCPSAVCTHAC